MAKRYDSDQMLLDLARNEGPDVVHLPYTAEFEAVCRQIKPKATTEDKHRIWEKLLDLRVVDASPAEAATPAQGLLLILYRPNDPLSRRGRLQEFLLALKIVACSSPSMIRLTTFNHGRHRKSRACRLNRLRVDRRCWRTSPTRSWRRVNSGSLTFFRDSPRLATATPRCAYRYWKMFQAEVLERWQPLELEVLFELDRIETIGRVRRMIQNELRLFRGVEETRRCERSNAARVSRVHCGASRLTSGNSVLFGRNGQ